MYLRPVFLYCFNESWGWEKEWWEKNSNRRTNDVLGTSIIVFCPPVLEPWGERWCTWDQSIIFGPFSLEPSGWSTGAVTDWGRLAGRVVPICGAWLRFVYSLCNTIFLAPSESSRKGSNNQHFCFWLYIMFLFLTLTSIFGFGHVQIIKRGVLIAVNQYLKPSILKTSL